MKGILSTLFVLSLVLSTSPALAADSAAGKKLYDINCSKCHDSSIHTRPDHKIKSLDALDKQLMGCSKGAHVDLSDADRANVEQYLNEQFYKFK
jgi:mono/diheme cytochrome c family protein